ncbi:MAG: DUF438 domain-containing protein, partial [bacterium]|nr:DUF438 domain-containing protein [bacterium]
MSELIDNRAHRIRTLKGIIKELHRGGDAETAKETLRKIVRETSSTEIAEMEQQLMNEGMPVEEVQSMCDVHSQVLREILVEPKPQQLEPGHPLDTFARENEALKGTIREMRQLATEPFEAIRWRAALALLMDVEKHYQRKENLLFSCLERHGVTGPSKVMWGKDDEVREQLKALDEVLAVEGLSADEMEAVVPTLVEPTLAAVEEMISKEERILFPMSQERLTDDEWGEIWS